MNACCTLYCRFHFAERNVILTERTPITNFLLLSVLTGILLVSGSLQCAFDCLTQADGRYSGQGIHEYSSRVDTCHLSLNHVEPTVSCLNKACHQRLPNLRDLGGPEIFSLKKLPQPIYSNTRQPAPLFRAGSAIIIAHCNQKSLLSSQNTLSNNLSQTLSGIRSTVLRC